MAVEVEAPRTAVKRQVALSPEKPPPIRGWAIFGLLWLAFYVYVYTAWVTGPDFTQVDQGPSQLPGWMDTLFAIYIPFGIVATVGALYWWVARPRIRDKRFST